MNDLIKDITEEYIRKDLPELKVGDSVEVYVKIKEGSRERVQMFAGTLIKMSNGKGVSGTFTVRRVSFGKGIEKTFMLHSPLIEKIVVVRHGRVRRAKLFYLRDRVGKAAKVEEKL